jgi:hypothetical protein
VNREAPIRVPAAAVTVEPGFAAAIDEVAVETRHLFLRRAWFAGAGGEQARTLVGRRPTGEVIAALPLVGAGPRGLGLSAVPGSYWPFRCAAVAADAGEAELAALFADPSARRTLGPVWRLGPMLDQDPTAALLIGAARRAGYRVLTRRTATAYALELGGESWPKPSTLRNLHKQEKKLARIGAISFRFVSGEEWSPAILDVLAQVERGAWAGSRAGADPKFVDPALRRGRSAASRHRSASVWIAGARAIASPPAMTRASPRTAQAISPAIGPTSRRPSAASSVSASARATMARNAAWEPSPRAS